MPAAPLRQFLLVCAVLTAQFTPGGGEAQEPDQTSANRVEELVKNLGGKIARDDSRATTPVIEIDLSGTDVKDEQLRWLSDLTELRTLRLHRTGISDAGLQHIKSLSRLTTLTIGDTRVTNAGLKSLAGLSQLEFLGLHGSQVNDAGTVHLKAFPHLKSLFLSKLPVSDDSLKHVKTLKELELLWLADSRITDAGLQELGSMVKLKSLSLSGTAMTDDGLKHLQGLKELVYLDVNGTNVTAEGLAEFAAANPVKNIHYHMPRKVPGVTIGIGDQTPEIPLVDLDGKKWTVAELHKLSGLKKPVPVVLTFWCSFCPSCRQVERDLDALARKYDGRAVVVALDASAGETSEKCRKAAAKAELALPILLDAGGRSADVFGTETTTTTVVIDSDGVLRYCGQFGHSEPALKAILAGSPVEKPTTPHVGCPIVHETHDEARQKSK